jgi:hypothetical protein
METTLNDTSINNNDVITEVDVDEYDLMGDLFEACDLVEGDEIVKDYISELSLTTLNKCDLYEGTLLMKYASVLWYDGIEILLKHGVDMYIENDIHTSAFMCVMKTYNNMMEQINVGCDSRYTMKALNIIKTHIQNSNDLDYEMVSTIMKNTDLCILHGKSYPISNEEYVKIIKGIAMRTFDGKFEMVDKIVNLFEQYGFTYSNKYLELSLSGSTIYNDGNMHFAFDEMRNFDSTRLLIEKFKKNKIDVSFLSDKLEKIKGSRNKDLISKWILGNDDWQHYYVQILEVLEE